MKKLKLLFILFLGIAGAAWATPGINIIPQGDTTHINGFYQSFKTPVDYIKVASGDNLTLNFTVLNASNENFSMWDILKADTLWNGEEVSSIKKIAKLTIIDVNNKTVVEQNLSDSSLQLTITKGLYKLTVSGQYLYYEEAEEEGKEGEYSFENIKTNKSFIYLMVGDADRILSVEPEDCKSTNSEITFHSHTMAFSVDYDVENGGYLTAELRTKSKVLVQCDTTQNKQISFENVPSVNASGSEQTYLAFLCLHKANGDTIMTLPIEKTLRLDAPRTWQLLTDSLPAHTLSADTLMFDTLSLKNQRKFSWVVDTLNSIEATSYLGNTYYALWVTITNAEGTVVAGPDTLGLTTGSEKGNFGHYPYKEISLPIGAYKLVSVLMKSEEIYDEDWTVIGTAWNKCTELPEDTTYFRIVAASREIDKTTTSTHTVLANGTWNFRKTDPTFGWVLDKQISNPKDYALGVSVLNAEGEAWVAENLLEFGNGFATDNYSVSCDPILPDTSYRGYQLVSILKMKDHNGKFVPIAGSEDTITFNVQVLKVKMVPQQSYTPIAGNWKNDKVTFMSFAKDTKPEIRFETENCYMSETLTGSGETKLTIVPMGGKTREIALTDSVYQLEVGNDSLYMVTFDGYFTGIDIYTTIYIRIGDAPLMSFEPAGLYDTATYTNRGTIKFTTRDAAFNVNVEAAEGSYTIANLIKYMNYKKEPMGADTVKDGKVSFKNLINDATYIVDFNVYSAEGTSIASLSANRFYVEDPTVAASVLFAPAFNADTTYTDSVEVTLTCYTSDATIKYSIDGSVPSLTYTKPVVLKETATIKAFAEKEGRRNSDTLGCLYTIETISPEPEPQPGQDTTYVITVKANNDEWGTVSGSGTYKKDTTVTISALAAEGYKFVMWEEDKDTASSRQIKVVDDATYTAVFEKEESTDAEFVAELNFAVYPNPTSGQFTVEVAETAGLEIYNVAGVCVLRSTVPAGKRAVELKAAGIYFVKMTAEGRTTVKRVIVR